MPDWFLAGLPLVVMWLAGVATPFVAALAWLSWAALAEWVEAHPLVLLEGGPAWAYMARARAWWRERWHNSYLWAAGLRRYGKRGGMRGWL